MEVFAAADFARTLAAGRAAALARWPDTAELRFFEEDLVFLEEARADALPVERFFEAMPGPSGYQRTRDYTYAA
jgi:hypothetical protein